MRRMKSFMPRSISSSLRRAIVMRSIDSNCRKACMSAGISPMSIRSSWDSLVRMCSRSIVAHTITTATWKMTSSCMIRCSSESSLGSIRFSVRELCCCRTVSSTTIAVYFPKAMWRRMVSRREATSWRVCPLRRNTSILPIIRFWQRLCLGEKCASSKRAIRILGVSS